ncbi:MAG: GNAT family N-acetyltransferase [Caldilineaceae bacterium]|nr:GNAT family N-acetyltransferase [Caldilineaceae bacterium]
MKQITSTAELGQAQAIRHQVFVEEQGIPAELEYDGADLSAIHVLAYQGEDAVATGRLLLEPDGVGVLGRIAVIGPVRGQGIGGQVVRQLEQCAVAAGVQRLILHPHAYLEKFYTALGYQTIAGGESTVGAHRLLLMEKQLAMTNDDKKVNSYVTCRQ